MRLSKAAFGFISDGFQNQATRRQILRTFSASIPFGNSNVDNQSNKAPESTDDFERRIFGGFSGNNPTTNAFYENLDRLEKARDNYGPNSSGKSEHIYDSLRGLDDEFNSLSDGMDGKLKKAATYFEFNPDEILDDDYAFRPDISFRPVVTYETKDLDLTEPGIRKFGRKPAFEVTTKEVLEKADFRNVRFLSNFLTESGLIFKRKQTKISAKAQRKIAREIKTARAFGLMPFTTMGTKSFVYGKTMEAKDEDFEYESYNGRPGADADVDLDAAVP
ncbi:hypothetical protein QQ045_004036 [Rhodiola kirilowii]